MMLSPMGHEILFIALFYAISLIVAIALIKKYEGKSIRVLRPSEEVDLETWPDTMACDCCGHPMTYVSEDLGYTCTNSQCIAHIGAITA